MPTNLYALMSAALFTLKVRTRGNYTGAAYISLLKTMLTRSRLLAAEGLPEFGISRLNALTVQTVTVYTAFKWVSGCLLNFDRVAAGNNHQLTICPLSRDHYCLGLSMRQLETVCIDHLLDFYQGIVGHLF